MIDTDTYQSPGWWLKVLAKQLQDRRAGRDGGVVWNRRQIQSVQVRPGLDLLDDYLRGDPPLRDDIHSGWSTQMRQFVRMGRLNIADLLVTSVSNRLNLRDFKTANPDEEDRYGDAYARDLMRVNGMATVARDVHETMLGLGDSYVIVTPPDETRDWPVATAEEPQQVITAHDSTTGRTLAALKLFRDEWDEADYAYVFVGGEVHKAIKAGPSSVSNGRPFRMTRTWEWDGEPQLVPGGIDVPVFRFRNRKGIGEFEHHLDALDRINDKIFNEWWIGKIQAFRQRAVKNLPEEDSQGNEIDYQDMFTVSPDVMWQVPDGVEFWESQPIDLGPVINSIQKDLERLAAVTSRPLHTISPDAAATGSAEGAALMKEQHLYQVEDRLDRVRQRWAEVAGCMFAFDGREDLADPRSIEALFGPVERFSLAEKTNAVSQVGDKLPVEAIWVDILQYPPSKVEELHGMMAREPADPLTSLGSILDRQATGLPTTAADAAATVTPPAPPVTPPAFGG